MVPVLSAATIAAPPLAVLRKVLRSCLPPMLSSNGMAIAPDGFYTSRPADSSRKRPSYGGRRRERPSPPGALHKNSGNASFPPWPGPVAQRESIGVGRADWIQLPLPPNRTCGSPASGSPVNGSPTMRIDEPAHGQLPRRTGHARQRKHSASDDDRFRGHVLDHHDDGEGRCANASGPSRPSQ